MSKLKILVILIFALSLLTTCKDELKIEQKEFPFFLLDSAMDISYFGSKFSVNWLKQGSDPCSSYGVVWNDGVISIPTIDDTGVRWQGNPPTGKIILEIKDVLASNKTYYARVYAKTSRNLVYSKAVSFKTQKYPQPVILSFDKETVVPGSEITAIGKYFKTAPNPTAVILQEFNSTKTWYSQVYSITSTSIVIWIVQGIPDGKYRLVLSGDYGWVYSDKYFYVKK